MIALRFPSVSVLLILCFFVGSARSALVGWLLVREREPELYDAFVDTFGEREAQSFFQGFTDREIEMLYERVNGMYGRTAVKPKGISIILRHLYTSYGDHIFGVLGEMKINVIARRMASSNTQFHLMDELRYQQLAQEDSKSEGIVFSLSGDWLIIEYNFESKMGAQNFDSDQAKRYLNHWKENGLRVPVEEKTLHFRPERIALRLEDGGRTLPIASVTIDQLKQRTHLVGTRERQFSGIYHQILLKDSKIRQAIMAYIENLLKTNRPRRPSVSRPQTVVTRPRIVADPPTRTGMPRLEGGTLASLNEQLIGWIFDNRRWPVSESECTYERLLNLFVRTRGGQGKVFVDDLSNSARHVLATFRNIPAQGSLERRLLESTPADPWAQSVLRAYIRVYERDTPSANDGCDGIAFIRVLRARIPDWDLFFNEHDAAEFRVASVDEIHQCLDEMSEYLRKQY